MTLKAQQARLKALGYYNDAIDGVWGPNTDAAFGRVLDLVEKARNVSPPEPPKLAPAVSGNFPLPTGLPANYKWMGTIGTLPRLLQEGLKLYGVKEGKGALDNPVILGWAKDVGLEKVYVSDATAWCGLWMAKVVSEAGYDVVAGPLWALNWSTFGVKADTPSLGDILVFNRYNKAGKLIGGHVGEYVGEDADYYHVLGGNTQDDVSIGRIAKTRLKAARRPAYKNPLASWKPYMLAANGVITTNEA